MPRRRAVLGLPAAVATFVLLLAGCARPLGHAIHDGPEVDRELAARADPVPLSGRVWHRVSGHRVSA